MIRRLHPPSRLPDPPAAGARSRSPCTMPPQPAVISAGVAWAVEPPSAWQKLHVACAHVSKRRPFRHACRVFGIHHIVMVQGVADIEVHRERGFAPINWMSLAASHHVPSSPCGLRSRNRVGDQYWSRHFKARSTAPRTHAHATFYRSALVPVAND
jgi:hypothetical protein